ncbi:uncharacterized protein ARMOST_10152 [Armillaria ostoyae]|uniref:Peptidase C14 caspase domain-containing protein n=1 Tax=Armillaria ostoyae TaxID=47428 RepID=A0A284RDI6_ARMOS|nr:uncharacterized protein ARMOST_10152 [Armillaria ostoyae]
MAMTTRTSPLYWMTGNLPRDNPQANIVCNFRDTCLAVVVIRKLVQDAKPGDRCFFQYSGHVGQVENKNNSEEDGMDECLIPCDHNDEHGSRMIMDNVRCSTAQLSRRFHRVNGHQELWRHLVDALPIGSSLVAVFDSCHSASLLDLDHFRCNRVYVPWISKGRRRSDFIWNRNVRRQAMALINVRSVYQTKRVSKKVVKSKKTSIERIADSNGDVHMKDDRWLDDTELSPIPRCDSPIAIWPCDGFCKPSDVELPHAISLGSCKDDQLTWEDSEGASMAQALIDVLNLMTNVSHEVHNASLNLQSVVKTYKKDLKEWRRHRGTEAAVSVSDAVVLEIDNFQDPQVSVLECLSIHSTISFASVALQSQTPGIFSRLHLYPLVS